MIMPIVLASTSPRRQQLLTQAKLCFDTMGVEIDESCLPSETPVDYITRMSLTKTQAVLHKLPTQAIVISADTIGVLDEQILGKPKDYAHAVQMWQAMSDTSHWVWTSVAVSVVKAGELLWQQTLLEQTQVTFVPISLSMMEAYWATGEPCDKAGAYAIQGFGASWVKSINGSYTNVVGLPLAQTLCLIAKARTFAIRQ